MRREPAVRRLPIALVILAAAAFGCGRASSVDGPHALTSPPTRPASGGGTSVLAEYRPGQIAWRAKDQHDVAIVEAEYGMTSLGNVGYSWLCAIPAGQDAAAYSQMLERDSRVDWAEPNYVLETAEARGHSFAFDDGSDLQSGYEDQFAAQRLGLQSAHVASRGRGILVAVLDTGVDPDHPLLANHLVGGHDYVANDMDPTEAPEGLDSDGDGLIDEALGHGSHVAGIVALVAPEAQILPLRVLDTNGRGDAFGIARAVDYAWRRGARVINMSLGMLSEDRMLGDSIEKARAAGSIVVSSAGNWGAETPEEFPAASGLVSAVAATGADDLPTSFTSFGSFVSLCAPGEGIRSAYWNGHTAVWSGTSMSAPWVSGGIALLLAAHPTWTRSQILDRLYATATPFQGSVGASGDYGAGILDLGAALAPDPPGDPGPADDPTVRPTSTRP